MENKKKKEIINLRFPSRRGTKNEVINSIIETIKNSSIIITLRSDELFLIIDEALTNAMEHGNNWNPEKLVNIKITPDKKQLIITIKDEGCGFDINEIKNYCSDKEDPSPRGRGIRIIKHFCNPMWNKIGNEINMVIEIE